MCGGCNGQLDLCPFCRIPALNFDAFGNLGQSGTGTGTDAPSLALKAGLLEGSLLTPANAIPPRPCTVSGSDSPASTLPPLSLDGTATTTTTAATLAATTAVIIPLPKAAARRGSTAATKATKASKSKCNGEKKRRIRNTKGPHK